MGESGAASGAAQSQHSHSTATAQSQHSHSTVTAQPQRVNRAQHRIACPNRHRISDEHQDCGEFIMRRVCGVVEMFHPKKHAIERPELVGVAIHGRSLLGSWTYAAADTTAVNRSASVRKSAPSGRPVRGTVGAGGDQPRRSKVCGRRALRSCCAGVLCRCAVQVCCACVPYLCACVLCDERNCPYAWWYVLSMCAEARRGQRAGPGLRESLA